MVSRNSAGGGGVEDVLLECSPAQTKKPNRSKGPVDDLGNVYITISSLANMALATACTQALDEGGSFGYWVYPFSWLPASLRQHQMTLIM